MVDVMRGADVVIEGLAPEVESVINEISALYQDLLDLGEFDEGVKSKDGSINSIMFERIGLEKWRLVLRTRKELRILFGLFYNGQLQTELQLELNDGEYLVGKGHQDYRGGTSRSFVTVKDAEVKINANSVQALNGEFSVPYEDVKTVHSHLIIDGKSVLDYLNEFLERLRSVV